MPNDSVYYEKTFGIDGVFFMFILFMGIVDWIAIHYIYVENGLSKSILPLFPLSLWFLLLVTVILVTPSLLFLLRISIKNKDNPYVFYRIIRVWHRSKILMPLGFVLYVIVSLLVMLYIPESQKSSSPLLPYSNSVSLIIGSMIFIDLSMGCIGLLEVLIFYMSPGGKERIKYERFYYKQNSVGKAMDFEVFRILKNLDRFDRLRLPSSSFIYHIGYAIIREKLKLIGRNSKFGIVDEVFSNISVSLKFGNKNDLKLISRFFSRIEDIIKNTKSQRSLSLLSEFENFNTELKEADDRRNSDKIWIGWNVQWYDFIEKHPALSALVASIILAIATVVTFLISYLNLKL